MLAGECASAENVFGRVRGVELWVCEGPGLDQGRRGSRPYQIWQNEAGILSRLAIKLDRRRINCGAGRGRTAERRLARSSR